MTKRRAVRGGGVGRDGRGRAEEEGDEVEAAVLAAAPAPLASTILILCSISARLLSHCLRRGKRRAVPDATLGTETKTSKWFDAGMGRHEAETSPQQSGGGTLGVVDDDNDNDEKEESTVATVLRISELLSWTFFRTSRARPSEDLLRRWAWKEDDDAAAADDDGGEPSAVRAVTSPPCLQR
jgi:hypothetical protein